MGCGASKRNGTSKVRPCDSESSEEAPMPGTSTFQPSGGPGGLEVNSAARPATAARAVNSDPVLANAASTATAARRMAGEGASQVRSPSLGRSTRTPSAEGVFHDHRRAVLANMREQEQAGQQESPRQQQGPARVPIARGGSGSGGLSSSGNLSEASKESGRRSGTPDRKAQRPRSAGRKPGQRPKAPEFAGFNTEPKRNPFMEHPVSNPVPSLFQGPTRPQAAQPVIGTERGTERPARGKVGGLNTEQRALERKMQGARLDDGDDYSMRPSVGSSTRSAGMAGLGDTSGQSGDCGYTTDSGRHGGHSASYGGGLGSTHGGGHSTPHYGGGGHDTSCGGGDTGGSGGGGFGGGGD